MNYDFLAMLGAGLTLGFSAGISPGPLLALTISETLKYGVRTGVKVAAVPLLTDTPIVFGSIYLLSEVKQLDNVFAAVSIIGAIFLTYFGIDSLRTKPEIEDGKKISKISSVQKAIIANYLNPNPYVFWIAIGGPLFVGALAVNVWNAVVFIISFYFMLVGSKVIVVLIGGKMSSFFTSGKYHYLIHISGVLIIILAILLFIDGIDRLRF